MLFNFEIDFVKILFDLKEEFYDDFVFFKRELFEEYKLVIKRFKFIVLLVLKNLRKKVMRSSLR